MKETKIILYKMHWKKSESFFRLFNSFQEYVDFFFLNDLVDKEGNVVGFTGKIDFSHPFPNTEEEYIKYLKNTMEFVDNRNKRINETLGNTESTCEITNRHL